MNLWLATGDPEEVSRWAEYGIIEGILTNPDIVAKANKLPKSLFRDLCAVSPGPVFYQLDSATEKEMLQDAEDMLSIHKLMGIKVPATRCGMKVMAKLSQAGHAVLATCVPDLTTLLLAVLCGATRITPYGSIWHAYGQVDKESIVSEFQHVIKTHALPVELIVGIQKPHQLRRFALDGIESFFIWANDFPNFFDLPLVHESESAFNSSWDIIHQREKG